MKKGRGRLGLLAAFYILAACSYITAQPQSITGISAIQFQQKIYLGGYSGPALRPVPYVMVISSTKANFYSWDTPGMLLSVRESDGNIAISGSVVTASGLSGGLVVLFMGDLLKAFLLNGTQSVYLSDGIYSRDSLVLTGYFPRSIRGDLDVFVARLGLNGSILSMKCYGSVDYPDVAKRIIIDGTGFAVLGETWAYNVSQGDVLLLQLDDNLSLKTSMSIGGAGIDVGEDIALSPNGDYVIVGTSEGGGGVQGFAARISRVGGLLWLRGYSTLGDTFLKNVYVDGRTGRAFILGSGVFVEDRRDYFLLVLDELGGWTYNEARLEIIRVLPSVDLSGYTSGREILLYYPGGVVVADLAENKTTNYIFGGVQVNRTSILNDTDELSYYSKAIYGWRVLRGVVRETPCPNVTVVEFNPRVAEIPVKASNVPLETGVFKKEFNLALALRRFLERNVPIFILLPVFVAFTLIVYYSLRGSSKRSS
ncbi:MAG: hypothetical protein ABWK01_08740 [Infirmifilum sp.]